MKSISLLGVRIDRVDMPEALRKMEEFILSGMPHMVVTADASAVVIAQSDEEFRKIVNDADMVTPDSTGIIMASKWYGEPLKEKASGVDLTVELCSLAAEKGYPVFLFGAAPGVADEAAENLKQRFPGLIVAGTHHGFFQDDTEIIEQVASSGAKILFVALGIPKQEKWIAHNRNKVHAPVMMGVGASLDFIAGAHRRAPIWMQRSGLEWLFRLLQEPSRLWRRYLSDLFVFGLMFAREWLEKNIKSRPIRSGQLSRRKGRKPVSSAEG